MPKRRLVSVTHPAPVLEFSIDNNIFIRLPICVLSQEQFSLITLDQTVLPIYMMGKVWPDSLYV